MEKVMDERRTWVINPPPQDHRCEVCGRHISELKPFGGKGDPLVGDFTGAFLVKRFRTMAKWLTDEQLEDYRKKYGGRGRYASADLYEEAMNTITASWECRDCIVLSDEDYFKKKASCLKVQKYVKRS